jgi:Protein of unknown function (DUF3866)
MALTLRRGTVTAISEQLAELVRLEVDELPCVAYPRLTGAVEPGDDVLVNEQARLLGLGSGGFDILYANLTRGLGLAAEEGAHVMALPYTPGQLALRRGEEDGALPDSIGGMPVVLCTVHSQVAPVCAALAGVRVAYVQVAGGALPVSLSDTVRLLRDRGLLGAAIAVAPCLDGEIDCVSSAAALAWAAREGYRAVVCSVGPGIVGTGTFLGHGAVALVEVANNAGALGGRPILAQRMSERDARARHEGVSHHVRAVRQLVRVELDLPSPEGAPDDWAGACAGVPLSHMGRGPEEDPVHFRAAFAAGLAARELSG